MNTRGYGSDKGGGFNVLSKAYKSNPTIENYVKVRRENPDAEIEVAVIGGLDQLFYIEPELRKLGIDPQLVAGAFDADPDAVSELSLQLMEKLIEARKLARAGETHLARRGLAIPDKLVDWLISCCLDSMSWSDNLEVPRDLIVLIRERFGGANRYYEQASRAHKSRMDAAIIAGQLKAQGIPPTLKLVGALLGVAPSTVKRWFKESEFESEAERWASLCNEDGTLKDLGVARKK